MAEIHHFEHAEDQRQPDGDEKQQHADDEAAGGLRHQTGGTGETAGKRVEIQGKISIAAYRNEPAHEKHSTGNGGSTLPPLSPIDQA